MCMTTEQVELYIESVQVSCKYLPYRITALAHILVTVSLYSSDLHDFFSLDAHRRGQRIYRYMLLCEKTGIEKLRVSPPFAILPGV